MLAATQIDTFPAYLVEKKNMANKRQILQQEYISAVPYHDGSLLQ